MKRGKDTFDCFVRDWWRVPEAGEASWQGRVPYPGAPKRYIAQGVSLAEARAICKEYNDSHEPGWQSRKAEFESA